MKTKQISKIIALALAAVMLCALLAACEVSRVSGLAVNDWV